MTNPEPTVLRRGITMGPITGVAIGLIIALLLAIRPAAAHHGWSGYDTAKAFTSSGVIVKSSYANPHSQIEVKTDEGKTWRFVLAPPSRMQSRGVTEAMIAVGKPATVHGYPHTSEAGEARIEYIELEGKRFELR